MIVEWMGTTHDALSEKSKQVLTEFVEECTTRDLEPRPYSIHDRIDVLAIGNEFGVHLAWTHNQVPELQMQVAPTDFLIGLGCKPVLQ